MLPPPTFHFRKRTVHDIWLTSFLLTRSDRDLKPDNVGFDLNGEVKLFDFGLAKELDESLKSEYSSDCYKLTGNTGNQRYIAPEVARSEPYNTKADVYSFGLLLWQVCSLGLPYEGLSQSDRFKYVVQGSVRPVLDPQWSFAMRAVMKRSWEPVSHVRPSMETVCKILSREIIDLGLEGKDQLSEFGSQMRLSTHSRHSRASDSMLNKKASLLRSSRRSSLSNTRF